MKRAERRAQSSFGSWFAWRERLRPLHDVALHGGLGDAKRPFADDQVLHLLHLAIGCGATDADKRCNNGGIE